MPASARRFSDFRDAVRRASGLNDGLVNRIAPNLDFLDDDELEDDA